MDLGALRKVAHNHGAKVILDSHLPSCLSSDLAIKPPNKAEILSLLDNISLQREDRYHATLHGDVLALELYLRDADRIQDILTAGEIVRLCDQISRSCLPGQGFAEKSPFSVGDDSSSTDEHRKSLCVFYEACLELLSNLLDIAPLRDEDSTLELVQTLASFTESRDSWTTAACKDRADKLLERGIKPLANVQALMTRLLREKVKPLFAKSKNPNVTEAGRKAIYPIPVPIEHSIDETALKPWKYRDVYIVTAFGWTLKQLDNQSIEANWPLIIPPLLAFLDDGSTANKVRGCSSLICFLQSVPDGLLARTGLSEVFDGTLMPVLLYLPTLTPEAESLQLLAAVYPALFALIAATYAGVQDQKPRQKALDRVFRYGIMKGYTTAGEHVKIAEFLVQRMRDLVEKMGIDSCKHLKHILPLLSSILSHPFATAYPPLLLAALEALEAILKIDWPRVAYYRGEILRGLVTCWLKVEEEDKRNNELEDVRTMIKQDLNLLTAILKRDVEFESEYQLLADSDRRLEKLLLRYEA